jgi:ABC-type transport system involved in multi-copper enzyme maturation permease subunit
MKTSIHQMLALARTTIKENIRNRALLTLILTGSVLFSFTILLGTLAIGDELKVVVDSGFWIMGIFGLITALFLGQNTIQGELQKKTIYMISSRPVERWVFIMGKFCGMTWVILVMNLILSLIFSAIFLLSGGSVTHELIISLASILIEWWVLAGFSLFFASFTTPLLHGFFLVTLYFIGHWTNYLYAFAMNTEDIILKKVLIILYHVFPNLEALNYRSLVLYEEPAEPMMLLLSLCSGLFWLITAIFSAVVIFTRRELR